MSKIGKFVETESRLIVAYDWVGGWGDNWGLTAKECGVSFRSDRNVLKLIVLMFAQLCDFIKSN